MVEHFCPHVHGARAVPVPGDSAKKWLSVGLYRWQGALDMEVHQLHPYINDAIVILK